MRAALCLAALLLLAGCVAETKVPSAAPAQAWSVGAALEGVGCEQVAVKLRADRAAVRAQVPERYALPGNAPVELILLLDTCGSGAIGNASLERDATFLLAYVDVQDGDAAAGYVLEFSSPWALPQQRLHAAGVPGNGARIASSGGAYRVAGDGTDYEVTLLPGGLGGAPPGLDRVQHAGTDGALTLRHHIPAAPGDRLDVPCAARFSSGPLSQLGILPACTAMRRATGWTLGLVQA